jgi:hypothetical protein
LFLQTGHVLPLCLQIVTAIWCVAEVTDSLPP